MYQINTIFLDTEGDIMRKKVIDKLAETVKGKTQDIIEMRLLIFCTDVANELGIKFFPIEKKNVLELWFHDKILETKSLMAEFS